MYISQSLIQKIERIRGYNLSSYDLHYDASRLCTKNFLAVSKIGDLDLVVKLANPVSHENVTSLSREISIVKRLLHENIVVYQDNGFYEMRYLTGELVNVPFLVTRKMETSLMVLMDYGKTELCWETAIKIVQMTTCALTYLRSKGVLHGDISPINILVNHSCNPVQVRLCDFGHSRVSDELGLDRELPYLKEHQPFDPFYTLAIDVYSLGALIFFICAHDSFARWRYGHSTDIAWRQAVPRDLRPVLTRIIDQLTCICPSDRDKGYRDCVAAIHGL